MVREAYDLGNLGDLGNGRLQRTDDGSEDLARRILAATLYFGKVLR
ncbi:hypothetical protein [Rhodococcus sp. PAMC28707]